MLAEIKGLNEECGIFGIWAIRSRSNHVLRFACPAAPRRKEQAWSTDGENTDKRARSGNGSVYSEALNELREKRR